MTLEVLQKTRVGMSVNSLRKSCSDDTVISLAKSMIKNWKKLLGGIVVISFKYLNVLRWSSRLYMFTIHSGVSSDKNEESASKAKKYNEESKSSDDATSEAQGLQVSSDSSLPKTFPKSGSITSDSLRLKCREMLTNALRSDGYFIFI